MQQNLQIPFSIDVAFPDVQGAIPQALMQTLDLSADNKSHGPSPL